MLLGTSTRLNQPLFLLIAPSWRQNLPLPQIVQQRIPADRHLPDKKVFAVSPDLNYTCSRNQLRLADVQPDCPPGKKDAMNDSAIWFVNQALRGAITFRSSLPAFLIQTGQNRTKFGHEIATALASATYDMRRISGELVGDEKTSTKQYKNVGGGVAETRSLKVYTLPPGKI